MKIGLFFGSFNPFHIGHLIMANHILEHTDIQKIWFIVSPQSPFKNPSDLLEGQDRLAMTKLAIEGYKNMRVSDIEFQLPRPSCTIDTLNILQEKYPKERFRLIMGEDLMRDFHKWKEANILSERYKPYVYPRLPFRPLKEKSSKIRYVKAPLVGISASFIRSCIKEGKNIRPLVPIRVWEYLISHHLYKK
ncbi:nicotinate (nicotinamide) nucleotide adenylyltransferase [Bacteroidetes bacterium endosymbiont of Geopemphigus sp.]|uniref:nicotinate (nicotinamide) nucleotide adenylyltransferase n=1 Tax=Bacteroidetes bacterium endosymbiont of Geopemphigus sp. TaxID=2047937 RepID=UPI000CD30738|nr:nicotinate (nicotinamide) nucleotide adenylyltransferase [Bacteroidetes bacterium endosymbiont of Geopemphigus sp.]